MKRWMASLHKMVKSIINNWLDLLLIKRQNPQTTMHQKKDAEVQREGFRSRGVESPLQVAL